MDAVRAQFDREVRPVVDQHGDAAFLRARNNVAAKFEDMAVGRRNALARFQAQLQAGDVARIERIVELVGKRSNVRDFRRGDEVEAAAAR